METLREGWTQYADEVLPETPPPAVRDLVEHAFYSGATALLLIGNTYRERHANEQEKVALMKRIIDEISEFQSGCEMKMLLHVLACATR